MSLQQKIVDALKQSMLARDADRTGTLRLVKAAMGYAQIEKKTESLTDADVLSLLQKEAKKRRDSIVEYEKGGRAELAAQEKTELRVIEEFLPVGLTPAEVEALVKEAIASTGATSKKDMGAVMKAATAAAAGRADGRAISAVVGQLLP
ncbi:MAG: GatB/YqeY domain-containing protein [Verrucomicrobia bacterium]|nr:MAG: GatB/YqeY domain-containing protein [Verrucomicrobiota bacterium]